MELLDDHGGGVGVTPAPESRQKEGRKTRKKGQSPPERLKLLLKYTINFKNRQNSKITLHPDSTPDCFNHHVFVRFARLWEKTIIIIIIVPHHAAAVLM
jgi:hypothetical protein